MFQVALLSATTSGLFAFATTGFCDQNVRHSAAEGDTSATTPRLQYPLVYNLSSPPGRLSTYCTSSGGNFLSLFQIPLDEFPFVFAPVYGRQPTVFYATAHCGIAQTLDAYAAQIRGQAPETDRQFLVYSIGFSEHPAKLYVAKNKDLFFICQPDLHRASLPRLCDGTVIIALGKETNPEDRHADLLVAYGSIYEDHYHFPEIYQKVRSYIIRHLK